MGWAGRRPRSSKVRTNAETPLDARTARQFGAEGIGLCRTEHMFFDSDRIVAMREMILAEDRRGPEKALAKLLPMQRQDFIELFQIMRGLPVTIRLLDPPLHEFLPHSNAELAEVAKALGPHGREGRRIARRSCTSRTRCSATAAAASASPIPEIYEMQARAIFEAAAEVKTKQGETVGSRDHDPAGRHAEGAGILDARR